jgi:hypothetical protein
MNHFEGKSLLSFVRGGGFMKRKQVGFHPHCSGGGDLLQRNVLMLSRLNDDPLI